MNKPKGICQDCKMVVKEQWIKLHLEQGIPITEIAKISGHHPDTLYIWKARYLELGLIGLRDQSRRPHGNPHQYPEHIKEAIKEIRAGALEKEKRYLGPKIIQLRLGRRYDIRVSASGIGKFLRNENLIPEHHKRRRPKKERIKSCKIHEPGELTQLDVKYAIRSYAGYWFYEYDAIDYMTGIVHGEIYEIQSNLESILFLKTLKRKTPYEMKGVQTDNGSVFTNYYTGYKKSTDPMQPRLHPFDLLCNELCIVHYLIDPGMPAQNGKIERFHRTVEEEFYQTNSFKDLNSLRKKFRDYLYYYNNEREHQGLDGLTPLQKLQSFPNYENIKQIY